MTYSSIFQHEFVYQNDLAWATVFLWPSASRVAKAQELRPDWDHTGSWAQAQLNQKTKMTGKMKDGHTISFKTVLADASIYKVNGLSQHNTIDSSQHNQLM